MYVTKL